MQRGLSSGYGFNSGPPQYNPGPVGGSGSGGSDGNILDQIRPYTSKVEDVLDNLSEPIKP